jgi:hypothetical protein
MDISWILGGDGSNANAKLKATSWRKGLGLSGEPLGFDPVGTRVARQTHTTHTWPQLLTVSRRTLRAMCVVWVAGISVGRMMVVFVHFVDTLLRMRVRFTMHTNAN